MKISADAVDEDLIPVELETDADVVLLGAWVVDTVGLPRPAAFEDDDAAVVVDVIEDSADFDEKTSPVSTPLGTAWVADSLLVVVVGIFGVVIVDSVAVAVTCEFEELVISLLLLLVVETVVT